jgi:hypothetical protein
MAEPSITSRATNDDGSLIPVQQFTTDNELYLFLLDMCEITCPDCSAAYYPDSLGEAVDWALGHECDAEVNRGDG